MQPHNEIANALATRGVAGLIAVLLLYFVPLGYFLRQRRQTDDFGRVAADMGVLTCIAVMLFGLTVTVFTSGWMMAHYVLLISLFLALSRPVKEASAADVAKRGQVVFPRPWLQGFHRRLYRTLRGRSRRHNSRLWPYVQLTRNKTGAIDKLSICGYRVPLVTVQEAFADRGELLHIVLSGPSIGEIDYARLPRLQAMGVNGSLLLQDKVAIDFPLYCLIDRSFVRNKPQIVRRIVDSDRIVFLPVDVLRYIFALVPLEAIRCRFCIVENIREPAYQRGVGLQDLRARQAQGEGAKVVLFNDQEAQGFSFDATLGWFDADTVAYAALQIAVWGGMKQLVFHGLDLTARGTATRFYDEGGQPLISRLDKRFATVIEPSFRQTMPLLTQRGIQVFNLSPHSALGADIIPFLDWKTFCGDAT